MGNNKYKKLIPILAGGGTRVPAHVGVLQALMEMDIEIEHIVGVSGGSIVASLFAAGWDLEDMKNLSLDINYSMFREFNLRQLFFHGGLSSGDIFENWMNKQLNDATFADLKLDFHVVATDVKTGSPVIFDKKHTPDFKVGTAVRYSMGIPILFAFKEYKNHLMVDGSILSEDSLRQNWAEDGSPSCIFRLRADKVTPTQGKIRKWFPFVDHMQMLIRAFMTTISREFINDAFWNATIIIDTHDVSPVEFNLPVSEKIKLMDCGYQTVKEIFPIKFPHFHQREKESSHSSSKV